MSQSLAERVLVLRDEVLDLAEVGAEDPPGAEIFDAIVRAVSASEPGVGLDPALHDAISRRLAWGEREDIILSSADQVCRRLLSATQRAFREPGEEMLVAEVATEVVCSTARIVAQAAISRAARERAASLREELAQRRLAEALERQREELSRIEQTLATSE